MEIQLRGKSYRASLDLQQCQDLCATIDRLWALCDMSCPCPTFAETEEQIDLVLTLVQTALSRFHPEITREKLKHLLDKKTADTAAACLFEYWIKVSGRRPALTLIK